MKKFTKIFTLILAVCMLCGLVAIATSAAYSVNPENQLVIPAVTDDDGTLISGNYAYNDGTNTTGWVDGNAGGTSYVNWDTSKGYINFTQKLSQKKGGNTASPYVEWNLSAGHYDTANMYTMNLRDYGYAVVDFDFGTNAYKAQIGYHVYYSSKGTTINCYVEPMYKTFAEISDADLQKAIDDNYDLLLADIETYQQQGLLADEDPTDADGKYAWTLAEAKASKCLALDPGSGPYIVLRSVNSLDLTDYANGKLISSYVHTYVLTDDEGNYYLGNDSTYNKSTALVPINGINDYKHLSYVCKITADKYIFNVYVDGEFMYTKSFARSSNPAMFLDSVRLNINNPVKLSDGYSFVLDNMTVNYYEKDYTSGDALGVDDLYNGATAVTTQKLYELSDVVYNKNFQGLGGSVTIGSKNYYVPAEARAAIAELKGNSYFNSTMALYNLDVNENVKSLIVYSTAPLTLSAQSSKSKVLEKSENYYLIREAEESEYVSVRWLDEKGNLIKNDKTLPGAILDIGDFNPNYVDPVTGILYAKTISGWTFDLGSGAEAIRPLTAEECEELTSLDITAVVSESVEIKVLYYVGMFDEAARVVRPALSSKGDYTTYQDATKFRQEVEAAANGSTVVIVSDIEVAPCGSMAIAAGKTISIDLNGYDFMALEGSRSAGQATFSLNEGASISIYSSRPGARIFDARAYHATPDTDVLLNGEKTTVKRDYQAYASAGFVQIKNTTDAATVNIGAYRGYAANLEYNGGTLVYAQGIDYGKLDPADPQRNEYLGGGKRIINVDGGKYYLIARPAFGMFAVTGPDVIFNVKNASFYSPNGTYSIFHDYGTSNGSDSVTKYPRFTVNSEYHISGCTVLGINIDNVSKEGFKVSSGVATSTGIIAGNHGVWAKLFYEIAKDSNVYIDNSTIIAQIYQNLNGKIYLGEGNVIATNSDISKLNILSGVNTIAPQNNYDLTLSYAHPAMYNDFDTFLELKEGQTNNYKMIDGVFEGDDIVVSASKPIKIVTFKDKIPAAVKDIMTTVEWYAPDGSLYAVTYGIIGDTVTPCSTEKFPTSDLGNGWYDIGYSGWINAISGIAEDYVLTAGVNKFTPKPGLVADIEHILIGMKLSVTEFDFYVYIPKFGADSGIEYNHKGDPSKNIGYYHGINSKYPYGWDNATTTNSGQPYLTENSTHYVNHFYIANDYSADYERNIRFLVSYDLNGDGNISADEQNIPLVYTINLSVINYSRGVIRAFDHDSDESTLAYEIVRYLQECARYTNNLVSSTDEKANVFYKEYAERCNCGLEGGKCAHILDYDEVEYDDFGADMTELKDYFYGAAYTLEISKPFFELYAKKIDGVSYTVKMTYETYTKKNGVVALETLVANVTNKGDKTIKVDGESVTAINFRVSNMRGYDTNALYTITVTVNDASGTKTLTGSYSLGQYIESNPNVKPAKALYVYSIACREYYLIRSDEQK